MPAPWCCAPNTLYCLAADSSEDQDREGRHALEQTLTRVGERPLRPNILESTPQSHMPITSTIYHQPGPG